MFDGLANYINEIVRGRKVRVNGQDAQWRKVTDIKVGQKIAVTAADFDRSSDRMFRSSIKFDEIVSIKKVDREQVYDIEVEGTHNFVGNGIVAHNTYINLDNNGNVKLVDNATGLAASNAADVYNGNLNPPSPPLFSLITPTGEAIKRIAAFSEAAIANLRAGFIQAEKITTKIIQSEKIVSPVVETEKIITNEIKPQNQDVIINLEPTVSPQSTDSVDKGQLARLIIKGLEGKTVTTIDSAGNASFSGQLIADSIQINADATVAGTLTADKIEAGNINDLTKTVFDQRQSLTDQSSSINDIQKLLSEIKDQPIPDPNYYQNLDSSVIPAQAGIQSNNIDSLLRGNDTIEQLTVTGNSNLYNVSIANSLLVGTTLIDQNSIISLASELRLSALAKINLFDGAVIIAKDGTITTRGELIAEKGVRTNEIKGLSDNNQVSINNLSTNNIAISDKYLDATDSASIIAAPDNFERNGLFAPAIEAATSSAGIGILPENNNNNPNEVVVYNDNIKKDSLVYITPTSDYPSSNQLTVVKKEYIGAKPYFKVVSAVPSTTPIKFNWLIIN